MRERESQTGKHREGVPRERERKEMRGKVFTLIN